MSKKKSEPDYVDVVLDVGRYVHWQVAQRAAFEGMSIDQWVNQAIAQYLAPVTASTGTTWLKITI